MTQTITIRPARQDDHDALADAFYKMWIDNGRPKTDFLADWKAVTLAFMSDAERAHKGQAFVTECETQIVGAAQCLISRKLYPQALKPDVRTDGYIWGVYVEPMHRRSGLATRLTEKCVTHLKKVGCTRVVLHASPGGQPVYAALGFGETNEMRLDIDQAK